MTRHKSLAKVWLVDPISYSGMAYTDVGQILALQELGVSSLLVGSDSWMLTPDIIARFETFRGTYGSRPRMKKGIAYIRAMVQLLTDIASSRPRIVHWQYTEVPPLDLVAIVVIKFLRVRQVYTAHELLPWGARTYHRWLFRVVYALVDKVIVHNDSQRDELIRRFGVGPSKVHVAPLGDYARFAAPELEQTDARRQLSVENGVPVVLFFGTIRPSKGLEVLIEAWSRVVRDVPTALLMVVGKPYKNMDENAIGRLIQRAGVRGSIRTVFAHVDPEEANTYYRASDVVVLPYHEIGTSGVLRYAYNSARPVIATSVGEHIRHVIPGATGQLIPPGDSRLLAETLIAALPDRDALVAMGKTAQAYASANFGWLGPAEIMREAYRDLLRN